MIVGHQPASKAERHKRKVKQASKFLKAFQAQQRAKNKKQATQEPVNQETQGEKENG